MQNSVTTMKHMFEIQEKRFTENENRLDNVENTMGRYPC